MRTQYLRLFYLHTFPIERSIILFILHVNRDLSGNLCERATRMRSMLHRGCYILLRIRSVPFLVAEHCYASLGARVGTVARMARICTILTFIPLLLLTLDN